MLSRKRNSLALLCLLLACCQKFDPTVDPEDSGEQTATTEQTATVLGTGEGTEERPYTVTDILSMSLSGDEAVWVIGYLVGTARNGMNHADFSPDATNQSNILLSADSLCTDPERCIPVELKTDKWRKNLSLPNNTAHFHKCLLVKGEPSVYLYRNGLRNVSAGRWLDGFDVSSVAPTDWDVNDLTSSQK